jgi:hypothetical protein
VGTPKSSKVTASGFQPSATGYVFNEATESPKPFQHLQASKLPADRGDLTNFEELPRVLGDAVGDEHDHVPARAGVAEGLAEDPHAEDELVAVQQRDVGLLRRRRCRHGEQQRRRDEGRGGQERRWPHRWPGPDATAAPPMGSRLEREGARWRWGWRTCGAVGLGWPRNWIGAFGNWGMGCWFPSLVLVLERCWPAAMLPPWRLVVGQKGSSSNLEFPGQLAHLDDSDGGGRQQMRDSRTSLRAGPHGDWSRVAAARGDCRGSQFLAKACDFSIGRDDESEQASRDLVSVRLNWAEELQPWSHRTTASKPATV